MAIEKKKVPIEFVCKPDGESAEWNIIFDPEEGTNGVVSISENLILIGGSKCGVSFPVGLLIEISDFLKSEKLLPNCYNHPTYRGIESVENNKNNKLSIPSIKEEDSFFKREIDPVASFDITMPSINDNDSEDKISSLAIPVVQEEIFVEGVIGMGIEGNESEIEDNLVSNVASEVSKKEMIKRKVIRTSELSDTIHGGDEIRANMCGSQKMIRRAHSDEV